MSKSLRAFLIFTAATALIIWLALRFLSVQRLIKLVPRSIDVKGTVSIGQEVSIGDGCGAVVFSISNSTSMAFIENQAAVMSDFAPRSSTSWGDGYTGWHRTPYPMVAGSTSFEDSWINGTLCAGMSQEELARWNAALITPGNFYMKSKRQTLGLLVVPSASLLLLSYFD